MRVRLSDYKFQITIINKHGKPNFVKVVYIPDEVVKQIRADAIDEFVRFANTMPTVKEEDGTIRPMWLEEMAERLKAGGENE